MIRFVLALLLALLPSLALAQVPGGSPIMGWSPAPSVLGSTPPDASGVVTSEQFISQQGGGYTLTSQTAAQKMFGSTTNGVFNGAAATSYEFECWYSLSSMSIPTGAFGFALGGTATFTYLNWWSLAVKNGFTGQNTPTMNYHVNSTADTVLYSANTSTVGFAEIRGMFRVNAAGTIIPEVSLGVAAAAVVGQDSFCRAHAIGSNTVVSNGNWN